MEALLGPLQYAILPVFAFPALGFVLGLRGAFSRTAAEGTNTFVVSVAVPCLLFRLIALADLSKIDWPVLVAYEGSLIALYALGYLICRHVFRLAPLEALLIGMTGAFPNHVFFILPIVETLYGQGATLPVATTVVFDTMIIFAGTIMILEAMTGGAGPLATLGSILKNPLIVAIFGGFAVNWAGIGLHDGLERFLALAGAAAAPGSLFALGVILSGADLRRVGGPAWSATILKTFVHPLCALALFGTVVPVSPEWEDPARLVFAAPCGAMAFILGLRYGVPVDSVAKAVILSTVLSVFTVALLA
ncbi:AEC family transporter [Pikeienuella piscinae]|uniref:AEC family transporter n=1 Tax=Pikeienuella piscinae TaxID=2748098 RepID=A0A7L5BYD9_9RHOB|nr:AEC family transporter [Pikeienuella piscinae]QIE55256.1 AEC family transporter [Pikeienuella piscinae]